MSNSNNKKIAKFMGGKLSKHPHLNGAFVWSDYDPINGRLDLPNLLKFDTSYNWIMPVWFRILELENKIKNFKIDIFKIKKDSVTLSWYYTDKLGKHISCFKIENNEEVIDCLYKVVVEFIDWYNL